MKMNNYGTKIKINLQIKRTGLAVSGQEPFQLCQFKFKVIIHKNAFSDLRWKGWFGWYFYTATDYIKFMNGRIRTFTNTRQEINKGSTVKVILGKQILWFQMLYAAYILDCTRLILPNTLIGNSLIQLIQCCIPQAVHGQGPWLVRGAEWV
jgi:hypothetical protein